MRSRWLGSGHEGAKLLLRACGPSRVVRGVDYSYTVVLTNAAETSYRGAELAVIHYDPIVRSSRPYRREGPSYLRTAVWTLGTLEPGEIVRIGLRLPFLQHNDPKGSNFMIGVRTGKSRHMTGLMTKDVWFVPR